MYLTYKEYQSYGGTLSESAFDTINFQAKIKIDFYTDNRLVNDTEFSENIKRANAEIVDLLSTYAEYRKLVTSTDSYVKSSESNDGVSVTYGGYLGNTTPSDLEAVSKKLDRDVVNVIKQYLIGQTNQAGQSLLYRGVY